jgi:glucose-1-phosphate cytidylyltransferase
MKVVILCGGLGTRLREETEFRLKPMVPVGGRPILWHMMRNYTAQGHKDFILCFGYKGEVIRDFFRNYHWNISDVTMKLGSSPQVQYHTQHDDELRSGCKEMIATCLIKCSRRKGEIQ